MKPKMLAFILALTVASWAQTATQATPATPQQSTAPAEKAKCSCCDKMAASNSNDAHACCARHKSDAKETASCCNGKDAKSCCAGKDAKSCMKDEKTASSCCRDCDKDKTVANGGEKCAKECANGCCKEKKVEAAAHNCCDHDQSSEVDPAQGGSSFRK